MAKLTNKKGFTLIEIVIVLAIAALILVAVLVAVQGAQASRRDTQRKNDAATVGSYLEQSSSNHSGNYPGTAGGQTLAVFNTTYMTNLHTPDNAAYPIPTLAGVFGTCPAAAIGTNNIQVAYNGRRWQVVMGLQSGDNFCTNS